MRRVFLIVHFSDEACDVVQELDRRRKRLEQFVGTIRVRLCPLLVLAHRLAQLRMATATATNEGNREDRNHDHHDDDDQNCAHA